MNHTASLEVEVSALIGTTHATLASGVDRESLASVRTGLLALASQQHLFTPDAFPMPGGLNSVLYVLHSDPGETMTLYVNVCGPGVVSPPHDHGTWAVIAGLRGVEENWFYRERANANPGDESAMEEVGHMQVEAGKAIALMPNDIHCIATGEQALVMSLHFYGLSLPNQIDRRAFGLPGSKPAHYAPQPAIRAWPR